MGIEVLILPGDDRVDEVPRKIVDGYELPLFLCGKFGDEVAVYVEEFGRKRGSKLDEVLLVFDVDGLRDGKARLLRRLKPPRRWSPPLRS